MVQFLKWLNEEIEEIKSKATNDNLYLQGKLSEAIRIRAVLEGHEQLENTEDD